MQERVVCKMSPECKGILKEVCAMFGVTMDKFLYDMARQEIHQAALRCCKTEAILKQRGKELDPRVHKACWGMGCYGCVHEGPCRAGLVPDTRFEIREEMKQFVKPEFLESMKLT